MRLFHIVEANAWARARARGEYRPASVADEGFVHFSFADQVAGTANARFREVADLVVIELDPAAITAEIRVEDSYGAGAEFPHVYGPIPTAAVVATHDLGRDDAGDFTFSPDDRAACASTDR